MKKNERGGGPAGDAAEITAIDYLRAVKSRLRSGNQKVAFELLQQAAIQFPNDPVILSYYGCLQAIVDKKYRSGVETCRKAIALLKRASITGREIIYPVFYLNLGRAYLAADKKEDAISSFNKGLQYDSRNSELLKELRALGIRKPPPVPFLDRTNLINIYIGKLLRAAPKRKSAAK
jgi:tetratricopeptide (TPR) repeat protein